MFSDYRDQEVIEYTVEELLLQKMYGIALGYEDLNDHDQLRRDPLLAVLCKKKDPTGQDRRNKKEKGEGVDRKEYAQPSGVNACGCWEREPL